ncbi:MAG: hypothetical protein E6K52_01070 [Gammaproteobacteria bacterium]|nr:MAG: hypothetical protein E6K52_01070 [Gammaproteobacteria bacterium]
MTALGSIVSYGAYVPRLRLPRERIAAAMQWLKSTSAARAAGSRAICNWDEDSLTLAVEAARACLLNAGADADSPPPLCSVSLASTTLPFADRSNATLLAAALDLPVTVETADFSGSLRAGTTALAQAVKRTDSGLRLPVAADARLSKPGSAQELEYGAGAAALLIAPGVPGGREAGRDERDPRSLGDILSVSHLAADFVDHYRLSGESFDYALEERWVRDEAVNKLVPAVITKALEAADLSSSSIDHFVMAGSATAIKRIAEHSGLHRARIQDALRDDCGDTGAAHPLLLLAAAIETAAPGQHILAIGFGQGVDALVVRIPTPKPAVRHRTVVDALARRKAEQYYTRYLSHSGLLEADFGMRAERDNRSAHSVAWRKHRQLTAFVGGRCRSCNTVQYPKSPACVNPQCRRIDTQTDYRLADVLGRVKSFTEDWQAFSPRPPSIYGNVEFEPGGNLLMELTDLDAGEVAVGMPVNFVFRVKDIDPMRAFKRYFWKATQV